MISLLEPFALLGFTLWGIYKGFWVCRKVYYFFKAKYDAWAYEERYVNGLAAQIRWERENGRVRDN